MALTGLFSNKGNFIGEIEIDVIVNESATATATVTKNPVENGADINDHIIIEPMTFSATGVVSNNRTFFLDRTKSQVTWSDLLNLQATREPFTLIQGLESYDNVVIQSLTESQNKDTSNGLFFSASLTQIIIPGSDAPPYIGFGDEETNGKMTPETSSGLKQVA